MIRRRNLYVITPLRAGRLIEAYLPEKNIRVSTVDLKLSTEDDLLDLVAVLAYERRASVSTHRPIKWRIHPDASRRDSPRKALTGISRPGGRLSA